MKKILLISLLVLRCYGYSQEIRTGIVFTASGNMGQKVPQVGGTISVSSKHFQYYSDITTAWKIDGGVGVSGINSVSAWKWKLGIGARHSWLAVRYKKQAIRPFIAVGTQNLNLKYVYYGNDNQNHLQAILFEWKYPIENTKWRLSIEPGVTFFHQTFYPPKRYVGGELKIKTEYRW